ncbi:hypothetical protein LDENG_00222310 [Lucifuga dentata]|nr:hypothetical protein LDENG_00222310 [Lucifuga dentata]
MKRGFFIICVVTAQRLTPRWVSFLQEDVNSCCHDDITTNTSINVHLKGIYW